MDFLSANSGFEVKNHGTYLPRITRETWTNGITIFWLSGGIDEFEEKIRKEEEAKKELVKAEEERRQEITQKTRSRLTKLLDKKRAEAQHELSK